VTPVEEKQMIQDWLDHPAWDVVRSEMLLEIETMVYKMIHEEEDSKQLKADIRARQAFLNKLQKYNG
jgi:tRNA A22 N-methylase